jgi:uncharacterized protein (TIGR03067 family)
MKRLALSIMTVGLVVAARTLAGEAGKKDLEQMQGTWMVASLEVSGKPVPAETIKGWQLLIQGDKYSFQTNEERIEGMYKLDAATTPKTIDATRTKGPDQGKVLLGIYRLEGDHLTMCFTLPDGGGRPTQFATRTGTSQRLYVLTRKKS